MPGPGSIALLRALALAAGFTQPALSPRAAAVSSARSLCPLPSALCLLPSALCLDENKRQPVNMDPPLPFAFVPALIFSLPTLHSLHHTTTFPCPLPDSDIARPFHSLAHPPTSLSFCLSFFSFSLALLLLTSHAPSFNAATTRTGRLPSVSAPKPAPRSLSRSHSSAVSPLAGKLPPCARLSQHTHPHIHTRKRRTSVPSHLQALRAPPTSPQTPRPDRQHPLTPSSTSFRSNLCHKQRSKDTPCLEDTLRRPSGRVLSPLVIEGAGPFLPPPLRL